MDKTKYNDLRQTIRYLKDKENLSFRQIEQRIGLGRKKCSEIYSKEYRIQHTKSRLLDRHKKFVSDLYKDNPSLTAKQVYREFRKKNISISYQSVSVLTREFRKKRSKCYFELTFEPGEEAQVDWFFENHSVLGKVVGFIIVLSHSRYVFAHFFPRASFEFFIEGHLMAFNDFGGCTLALRYDNLKSVVLTRNPLKYNPAFLEFALYYDFHIRLCNPASGNEKGRVERTIRTIRTDFLNTAGQYSSLRSLNLALHQWVREKNNSVNRATHREPVLMKQEEQLKTLPKKPWNNVVISSSKRPTKTGMIVFDCNNYSIPEYAIDDQLFVHANCEDVKICNAKGNKVAIHKRSFEKGKTILNPQHRTFNKLSSKAKNQRIYDSVLNLHADIKQFVLLASKQGNDPFLLTYQLFLLTSKNSKPIVISAVREAIAKEQLSINYIHSILNKSSNPTEQVAPQQKILLTIDYTPRALNDYEK